MNKHNIIATTFLAALLIAGAGPALAKKQASGEAVTAQEQGNAKNQQAVKYCRRNPPPFMYNPRFMNRGFFKKKCPAQNQ